MYNDLFSIGSVTIHSYGLMIGIAIVLAFVISMKRAKKRGLDDDYLFNLGFSGIIGGIIAAKLLYIITDLPAIIADPKILLNFSEGFVVYGGVIGGIVTPLVYNRLKKREHFMSYLDVAIPTIPLGQGLGRIGCLLAGCCYGCETDSCIGIIFPEGAIAPAHVKLFPTQPISAIGDLIIAIVMFYVARPSRKKKANDGVITAIYMLLYSVGRFTIEFFRADYRGWVGPLSTSQFISIFIFIAGAVFMTLAVKGKFNEKTDQTKKEKNDMENFTFSTLEYVRPDKDELIKFYEDALERLKAAQDFDSFLAVLKEMEERDIEVENAVSIAFIRNTLDTTDKFYEDEIAYINRTMPELGEYGEKINKYLLECPYRDELDKHYGKRYLEVIKLDTERFKPEIIPLLQEEAELTTRYQKLMATAKIPFKGEELNLYGIQKHFEDDDREDRKAAVKAYSDFYHGIEDELEEIWDKLIKVRNKMGQAFGYENYIPLGHKKQGRMDYSRKEIESFRAQVVEEIVPLCEELYKAQKKRLGLDELYFYDEKVIFADGNAHPLGDDDFMIKTAKDMYHDLSPETAEFIDFMIEHEVMDLKNKPNKASTGYMTSLPVYKSPFVFSCLNGTIFDMQVLTHELGHAFAGYRAMRSQDFHGYWSESTDIAEIHSMSMEQFAYGYAEKFFGKDADKYRFAHLQEAITFVPFGCAVDEFQHICYDKPELTPKERTYEWHKLEEKYMPWRKYDGDEFFERGGYWYHKLHIFQYPMYYINYTFTTLGAMEFKKKFAENKESAWKDYLTLCDIGGSVGYLDTLKAANVSVPFAEGSVKKCISYAKDILEKEIANE